MIILDTNILSELLRAAPEPRVKLWLDVQDKSEIRITAVNEAELLYGVAIMPEGKRRRALAEAMKKMLQEDFRARILPFVSSAAKEYAAVAAEQHRAGRVVNRFDCQIAAIARVQGAAVATRNSRDFEGCGIEVINPWEQP